MADIERIRSRLAGHSPRLLQMEFPEAGVLVPVTNDVRSPEIVLTRRANHLRTHRGQVAFPGGRRDQEDASLLHTALRESEEEVGLHPGQVEVVGVLDQVVSRFGILVTPYVGLIPSEVNLVASPDELDAVFRVPVEFFLRDERKRTDVIAFRGTTLHVPCWQYGEFEIWGLSAMILANFVNVAFDAGIELVHYQRERTMRGERDL